MLDGGDGLNVMPRMDLHYTIPRKYISVEISL